MISPIAYSPQVLGAAVARQSALFDILDVSAGDADAIGVAMPDDMRHAEPKRRSEYVAGRYCAGRAVAMIRPGCTAAIATAADRSPVWPRGIVGSITHTTGFASAAVASADQVRGLGIDAEQVIDLSRARALVRAVLSGEDMESFPSNAGLSFEESMTLIFSAKESLFKSLHPIVRCPISFKDVLIVDTDPQRRTLVAVLLRRLSTDFYPGTLFQGRYVMESGTVHTGFEIPA